MASIPAPLTERYELLKELDVAYDLLDNLKRGGKDAPNEEIFLEQKISSIESTLDSSLQCCEHIIDQIRDDSIAWTSAQLHFIHGYEWQQAADRLQLTEEMIKSRVYRRFRQVLEKVWRNC